MSPKSLPQAKSLSANANILMDEGRVKGMRGFGVSLSGKMISLFGVLWNIFNCNLGKGVCCMVGEETDDVWHYFNIVLLDGNVVK